jgi:opacity protein-like surface antigen
MLLCIAVIGLPVTVSGLGLDVEAKAGAGIALGTTNNPNATGSARVAGGGGVGADLYLLNLGPVDLGISVGAEYSYLSFHSVWTGFLTSPFNVDQAADSNYSYLNFPIALLGRIPLTQSISVVVRAGGFLGYFLSGTSTDTYTPDIGQNGAQTLNSNNTYQWEYGLHFTAGTDIALTDSLAIAPALQFDMGLTDTTKPIPAPNGTDYKDTFWSLTLMVGIKYKVL